jgi:hypothetical protein
MTAKKVINVHAVKKLGVSHFGANEAAVEIETEYFRNAGHQQHSCKGNQALTAGVSEERRVNDNVKSWSTIGTEQTKG